jgi:enoyl-CoA hydratase/carnithine racemase
MNQPGSDREIRLERRLPSYWRVTFDLPPLNIFGPKEIPQLETIIEAVESDECVKVVVLQEKRRCMGGQGTAMHRPRTDADRGRGNDLAGGDESMPAGWPKNCRAADSVERGEIVGG